MERVICLLIGYVFGLFQTAYFYGKAKGIDIRKYGSGNAGTTNALRVLGTKAGLIVLAGDCLKCIVPYASPRHCSLPDIRRIFICCACTPVQEPSSDITSRFTWDSREEKESLPQQD